tara:strand:+ start:186 stop:605 length:420 start_codon:yes stop_codon:yes gene_type:complete
MAYTPFKMKGPSLYRTSPAKASPEAKTLTLEEKIKKYPKAANLLKAVPNKEAYDKLSDIDKKGFDKAAKKAGLPQKQVLASAEKPKGNTESPAKQKETYGGRDKKKVKKELSKHRKNIDKATTEKDKAKHSKKYYNTMF